MVTKSETSNADQRKKRTKGGRPSKVADEKIEKTKSIGTTEAERIRLNRIHKIYTAGQTKSFSVFVKEVIFALETSAKLPTTSSKDPTYINTVIIQLTQIRQDIRSVNTLHNQVVKRINSLLVAAELKKQVHEANDIIRQLAPLVQQLTSLLDDLTRQQNGTDK
ncbi:plasmid mobilization protein [Spirosoma endophyticum]|uniref:Uncharacterized protein n=1 Tax=Spirosoma endophyticum TaxID=662367 RepID=A0A1I2BI84_9BACT|nr:hypothetical protein [Spirosoma endophyticum]SFE55538.1 hypothetical protein SAMN05216167_115102 [Spirosoma endophyticum]